MTDDDPRQPSLGRLGRIALTRVPHSWRDSVLRDLLDEAAREGRQGAARDRWLAWQLLRVGIRFSRESRRRRHASARASSWSLRTDVRLALRGIRRDSGSALAVVLTLALGIGAATATYGVLNYAVLRPVPGVEDDGSVVSIYIQTDALTANRMAVSHAHLEAMRNATPALTGLAAWNWGSLALATDSSRPPRTASLVTVTSGFFEILGVRPRLGRFFTADEYESTGTNVLVISERLWRREFNRDPTVVGRRVLLNGHPFQIIGVARHYAGQDRLRLEDGWLADASRHTLTPSASRTLRDGDHFMMVGRLAPAATLPVAQSQLTAAFRSVGEWRSGERTFWPIAFAGVTDGIGLTRSRLMTTFRLMLAGVALLLLLACANAANLMIARHLRRRADLAVRHALGASRRRLLRELLVEAGLVAVAASLVALGMAAALTSAFRTSRLLSYLPVLDELSLDWRAAAFSVTISSIAVVAFALGPAVLASRPDIRTGIASGERVARRSRLRLSLIGAQLALSFTLVVAAALLVQAVHALQSVDFGFAPDSVLRFSFQPTRAGYDDTAAAAAMQRLHDRLTATQGLAAAALAWQSPLGGQRGRSLMLPGESDAQAIRIWSHDVTGEYFAVLGIPLREGRTFTPMEWKAPIAEDVPIILNEALARRIFGAATAVGQTLLEPTSEGSPRSRTVIGVVGNALGSDLRTGFQPLAYYPFRNVRSAVVLVRPEIPVARAADLARQVTRDVAPGVPIDAVEPLRLEADEKIAQERLLARLSLVIGALASLIALAGVYAAVAQFASERRREFAIRMAIGANRPAIARGILGRLTRVVAGGLLVGGLLIALLDDLLAKYLFGISPHDPFTIGVAAAALTVTAIAAAWPGIHRATRVDPAAALRAD